MVIDTPAIVTSDTLIHTGPAEVHWVVASAGATGGAATLDDGTTDAGTEKLSIVVGASSGPHIMNFDPPIAFKTGIFADIAGTNVTLTVGWRK